MCVCVCVCVFRQRCYNTYKLNKKMSSKLNKFCNYSVRLSTYQLRLFGISF